MLEDKNRFVHLINRFVHYRIVIYQYLCARLFQILTNVYQNLTKKRNCIMMKKSFFAFVAMIGLAASLSSCQDWGLMDPEPGTDVYPTRQKLETYSFNESANLKEMAYVKSFDEGVAIVQDDSLYNQSLHLKGALVQLTNPLTAVKLQNGAGFTFWLRAPKGQENTHMLSLADGTSLLPATGIQGLEDGYQHFVGVQVKKTGFNIYIDGAAVVATNDSENEALIAAINSATEITFGSPNDEFWIDDVTFFRNQMTEKDMARPNIKKGDVKLPDPVYFNDFNSGAGDAEIIGGGSFRNDDTPGFKKVFQNVTGGKRQNYLLLPSHVLSHSADTKKMTIGVWVNAANAGASSDYMWAPLFMAYAAAPNNGENTFPMFACQYRGVLQVNNNGWTDYTDVQNVEGANKLYHDATDWLADKQWHYYTVVFNEENAKVYFDGKVVNEWQMDGTTNTQMGLFTNGADLKYVCLGGNQAWNWGDNDPGFAFDDIAIYNDALSGSQIEKIIADKPTGGSGGGISLPSPVFFSDFSNTSGLTIVGGGSFTKDSNKYFGDVFQNVTGGMRQNYLLLPEDALSHSTESNQMSIGVWVNAANAGASADYMWAPLFTAYGAAPNNGENTFPMFACQYRGVLQVNNDGWTDYTDQQNLAGANILYHNETDWLADKEWHYYTAVFDGENARVYFDGVLKNEWQMDGTTNTQMGLFRKGADLKYICLGGNQAWNWGDNDPGFAFDDIAIYDVALSPTDIQNIMTVKMGGGVSGPTPYYRNTFDNTSDLQIIGGGSFATDPVHGKIFQNITGGMRQNYLLLPEDLLTHSAESEQLSISVWVNAAKAGASSDYMWAPLLMAYGAAPANGENTFPMFACQYRGVLQVNNDGWTDYTDAQNVAGSNTLYHNETDWLADKEWHLYTVVFNDENAKVYFDGVLKNEWQMDGTTNTQKGLFRKGGDLKYICLGGNQAWNWGDNDPGFAFDDIQFFDFALKEADIQAILKQY